MTKPSAKTKRVAVNKSTIFIQIAAYRDPELIPTLEACITMADRPANLRFGICKQYCPKDKFDDLAQFDGDSRFQVIDIPYKKSKGACWARNKIQQLYQDETYTLQLDSHHRFTKGWDTLLIKMLRKLQNQGHKKPLLTSYAPSYNPKDDPGKREDLPWKMDFHKFIPEGAVFFLPAAIPDWKKLKGPIPARFFSAHFAFTLGQFSNEVQHDPEYYFHGEEISIAVRAYTHGYDLFHPHIPVIWHEYTREGRTKHWDDHKEKKIPNMASWHERNTDSHLRNRKLFEMDGEVKDIDFGKYDFGTERTLRDYEMYSGLNFKRRAVQRHTQDRKNPPNPITWNNEQEWEQIFDKEMSANHEMKVIWDVAFLRDQAAKTDIDWIFFGIEDESGKQLYRHDLNRKQNINIFKFHKSSLDIKFQADETPHKWILWPVGKDNNFLEKYEEIILKTKEKIIEMKNSLDLSEKESAQLKKGLQSAVSL
jgi:hypothetical protein